MTKHMTLCDLETMIRVSEPYSCDGAGDEFERGFHHCRQWAGSLVKKNRSTIERGIRDGNRCANCGIYADDAEGCIQYGEEWVCSTRCQDQHDELGCPFEILENSYRHPVETEKLIALQAGIRGVLRFRISSGPPFDLFLLSNCSDGVVATMAEDRDTKQSAEFIGLGIAKSLGFDAEFVDTEERDGS